MTDRTPLSTPRRLEMRDVVLAAEDAKAAMEHYALVARAWNAPDDEHTKIQLRALTEEVIELEFNGA